MMTVDIPDCPKLLHKDAICECVGFGKYGIRLAVVTY